MMPLPVNWDEWNGENKVSCNWEHDFRPFDCEPFDNGFVCCVRCGLIRAEEGTEE